MIKTQDKAKEIRHLQEMVLLELKQQLADTKRDFRGYERKALKEQKHRTEKEIAGKLDKLPDVLKEGGYTDVQAFMATYRNKAGGCCGVVQTLTLPHGNGRSGKTETRQKEQAKPPERESVLKRLRQL